MEANTERDKNTGISTGGQQGNYPKTTNLVKMPQFQIGNKDAEKWTEENVYEVFMHMLSVAQDDKEVFCIQDVLHHPDIKLYRSGMDYLLEKFPVFGKYKKDIQDAIVSRVNKGALKGDLVSTPAIFRMKQLGEEEKQVHEVMQTNIIHLGHGEKPEHETF